MRLTWSRFAGSAFEAYEIRRRDVEADEEVLLAQITDPADTTLVDDTATADVVFEYTVSVNAGGEERFVSNNLVRQLRLQPVEIETLELNSTTASATLSWTQYSGPRFLAYRVLRSSASRGTQELARISSLTELTYTDPSMHGNTEYSYAIEVITDRDEAATSEPRSGIIHPLMTSWDLDVGADEVVRLYGEAEGVTALVAARSLVRTLYFDGNGQITDEQALVPHPSLPPLLRFVPTVLPRSVSFARAPDGRRFLGYSTGRAFSLLEFSVEGSRVVGVPHALFADSLAGLRVERNIAPEISIHNLHGIPTIALDNLTVLSDGGILLHEDFEQGMPPDWASTVSTVRDGWLLAGGDGSLGSVGLVAGFTDASWHDYEVEFDVIGHGARTSDNIPLGFQLKLGKSAVGEATLNLTLNWLGQLATFTYGFQAPLDSELEGDRRDFEEPLFLSESFVYRVALEFSNGDVRASIAQVESSGSLVWRGEAVEVSALFVREGSDRAGIMSAGGAAYSMVDGFSQPNRTYDTDISELRGWTITGSDDNWLGVCLPSQHQVIIRPSSSSRVEWPNWPARLSDDRSRSIGLQLGEGDGELLMPLSFDASTDGRIIYILDAGNGRIQVFDSDAAYITQWGTEGSAEGEFDFGSGAVVADFGGSIAVDDAGFIYVWDPGNRRIQKFAP